jgi:L-ascorbate metabolism protein UlaG (beta-lactamase superfamily)
VTLQLTWHGHATWLLESDDHRVLVDPFLAENPAATVEPKDLDADVVLLTHGHFDHVADAAEIVNRCKAKLVANFEIATWFVENHGVEDSLGMNLGGSAELPFGRVTMTVAWHSSQLPDGSYGGNPGGFIVEMGSKKIYFAGDTALFSDMQLIGEAGIDTAILPIGDLFTMGVEDSVRAAQWLGAKKVVPAHFNTWPPIEQDVEAWAELISSQTESIPIIPKVGVPTTL